MALSKIQFKQVLDAIFNNGNPDTEYINSANTPAIKMYLNEMSKNAELLKREDSNNKYVVAILQTENHPYLDNNSEIAFYTCKDIKDAILTTVDDLKEYNRGVSSYIPMKTYIRNICAFLGINMSANFDTLQPVYYQDMVDIVKKYCTLSNKGLAYWGRYDVSGTATYKSYVPVMCLVDIAVYLNTLLVYSHETINVPLPYPTISSWENNYEEIGNWYDFIGIKGINTYLDRFQDVKTNLNHIYIEYRVNYVTGGISDRLTYKELFNAVNLTYPEIDYTQFNYMSFYSIGSDFYLRLYSCPLSCSIFFTSDYRGVTRIYNKNEEFNLTLYQIQATLNNDEITYSNSKTITTIAKETNYDISIYYQLGLCNIKCNKYLKPYRNSDYVNTNYKLPNRYPDLNVNQFYNMSTIKKLNYKNFYRINYNLNYPSVFTRFMIKFEYYLEQNNVSFDENDLVYLCGNNGSPNKIVLYIFKNPHMCKSSFWNQLLNNIYYIVDKKFSTPDNLYAICVSESNGYSYYNTNINIEFDSSVDCIILSGEYDSSLPDYYTFTKTQVSNTTFTLGNDIANNKWWLTNLGEIVTVNENGNLEGLELQSGATYPNNVVDLNSFISTYSGATYRTISNPYYEDDELVVTNLHIDTWVACNTTKNIPVDQSTAQDPNVDDLTDDDMKDIDKDIQNSTENNDDEDEDSVDNPDDYKKDENEGENEIPTINDVFHYGYSSFINQWVLNQANLNEFGKAINNKDFIDLIVGLVADPLDALISLQVVPISLMPTFDTTARHIYIRGQELFYKIAGATEVTTIYPVGFLLLDNVSEFDLGKIEIGKNHDNYLDIDETKLTLYLPFAGNIELDIRDFYGGSIHIKGFCETYTGQLIYYVISEVDNLSRIITTITANCFSSIPLKSDGFASLLNGFTRG